MDISYDTIIFLAIKLCILNHILHANCKRTALQVKGYIYLFWIICQMIYQSSNSLEG